MFGICADGTTTLIARFAAPMAVRSNQPIYLSDTLSLKRSVTRRSAQRWEIESNLEPLSSTSNDLFTLFVTKGHDSAITVLMPQPIGVIQRRTAATATTGAVNVWATSATLTMTGFLPKGSFVKFASHNKIYMTTTDRTGSGAVSFYPNLQVQVSAGSAVSIANNVLGTFLLDIDSLRGMAYTDGILMDNGTVKLVERL